MEVLYIPSYLLCVGALITNHVDFQRSYRVLCWRVFCLCWRVDVLRTVACLPPIMMDHPRDHSGDLALSGAPAGLLTQFTTSFAADAPLAKAIYD